MSSASDFDGKVVMMESLRRKGKYLGLHGGPHSNLKGPLYATWELDPREPDPLLWKVTYLPGEDCCVFENVALRGEPVYLAKDGTKCIAAHMDSRTDTARDRCPKSDLPETWKWLLIPLTGEFRGMFALENKGGRGHFLDAGGPGTAHVPKKKGWHNGLRWKLNEPVNPLIEPVITGKPPDETEQPVLFAPPVPFDNSLMPPVVPGELLVHYTVQSLMGPIPINHDAIWVGHNCFEVSQDGTHETDPDKKKPLLKKDRTEKDPGEWFLLLGSVPMSIEEVTRIADAYPRKNDRYLLMTDPFGRGPGNNCWNFARWFCERLGFNPGMVWKSRWDGWGHVYQRYYRETLTPGPKDRLRSSL